MFFSPSCCSDAVLFSFFHDTQWGISKLLQALFDKHYILSKKLKYSCYIWTTFMILYDKPFYPIWSLSVLQCSLPLFWNTQLGYSHWPIAYIFWISLMGKLQVWNDIGMVFFQFWVNYWDIRKMYVCLKEPDSFLFASLAFLIAINEHCVAVQMRNWFVLFSNIIGLYAA